jgi:DHA1 family bicyclomycin/chloramphenicol resistance-like MFS transporter
MAIASVQLLYIAWLNEAPFAWVWSCMCLYMFTIALIAPNSIVMALDPLPSIAGVASSIIGTLQNVIGASGALIGAIIYNGTVRNTIIIMGIAGVLTASVFLLRPLIVRGPLVHHPDELARD